MKHQTYELLIYCESLHISLSLQAMWLLSVVQGDHLFKAAQGDCCKLQQVV